MTAKLGDQRPSGNVMNLSTRATSATYFPSRLKPALATPV